MTHPTQTPSDPPDLSCTPIQPLLTPEHRALLKRLRPKVTPELQALKMYFDLRDGSPEEQGCALDVLGRLLDLNNGYMTLAWHIALDWTGAAHGRYDPKDLVRATADEIQKALERPSGGQVLEKGWPWLIRTSARRARAQADLNGRGGKKAVGERGIKDALKRMDLPELLDEDEMGGDAFLDDEPADTAAEADADEGGPHIDDNARDEAHTAWDLPGEDGAGALSKLDYTRAAYTNDMESTLAEMHHNSADIGWMVRFFDTYPQTRAKETDDPQRLAILDVILNDKKMSQGGKIIPELASLGLTRDRANALKRQERSLLLGRLRHAAEMDGIVSDHLLYLICQRLKRG